MTGFCATRDCVPQVGRVGTTLERVEAAVTDWDVAGREVFEGSTLGWRREIAVVGRDVTLLVKVVGLGRVDDAVPVRTVGLGVDLVADTVFPTVVREDVELGLGGMALRITFLLPSSSVTLVNKTPRA